MTYFRKLVCLGVAAAATLAAQLAPDELRVRSRPYVPPPPPDTLRTEVRLVEVPVVVRDGKRRAIGGLQQSDFEIYDAGKKQAITAFAVETFTSDVPAVRAPGPAGAGTKEPAAAPPRPRYVLLCFDNLNFAFEDMKRTKDAAIRFVRTGLSPGDRVAILTTGLSNNTTFTTDVEKLVEEIGKVTVQTRFSEDRSACPHLTAYQAYLITNGMDSSTLDGVVDEDMACKQLQRSQAVEDVKSMSRALWENARANSHNTLRSLHSMVDALGKLPGKRMLLLTSSGFLSGNLEFELDQLTARAVRAEVVINSLDAKGLYAYAAGRPIEAPAPRGRSIRTQIAEASIQGRQAQAKDDGMAVLAHGTGGQFYHNSNNLDQGFKELGALPEVVYVLGFSPEVMPDGQYHSLKVKLARGRGTVQSRLGYMASKEAAAPPRTPSKLDLALTASGSQADVPATVGAQQQDAEGGLAKLLVVVNVDVNRLRFESRAERRVQKLTVLAALLNASGDFVTGVEGDVEVALKPENFDRIAQEGGINMRIPLLAPSGKYTLRSVVIEGLDGKMTTVSQAVELR